MNARHAAWYTLPRGMVASLPTLTAAASQAEDGHQHLHRGDQVAEQATDPQAQE